MRSRLLAGLVALCALVSATSARAAAQIVGDPPEAAGVTVPASATPDRQRQIDDQIRSLREAIGEASAEEVRIIRDLSATQTKLAGLDHEVARIDRELALAGAKLARAQGDVERLDGHYLALSARVADTNREIDRLRGSVDDVTGELYRRAGSGGEAFTVLALEAKSPHELFAASRYLAREAVDGRARVHRLAGLKQRLGEQRDQLEGQRDAARAARDVVAGERARILSLKVAQVDARRQVAGLVDRQQGLLEQIRSQKSRFNREIAALQAESNSIADLLRRRQSGQTFVPGNGILSAPVNAPITSGFGPRVHPIYGTVRMHSGIDFGASSGTPIHAAADGDVVWAGPRGGYGNAVIIDHGNTLATLYAHQSSVASAVGRHVSRGQVIGYVGSTGLSTGPHLHFEVRVNGTPVNPLKYL